MIRYYLLLLLTVTTTAQGADWYVSTVTKEGANGTIENPWKIEQAFGSDLVYPAQQYDKTKPPQTIKEGDTIYLRGGVYQTVLDCQLSGVTICSYPGEWAKIDLGYGEPGKVNGGRRLYLWGNNTTLRNLEVFCSNGKRLTSQTGPWPSEIDLGGVVSYANGIRYIGCVFHNLEGIMLSKNGGEIADCIISSCGWMGGDNAHGHGAYIQNRSTKLESETDPNKPKLITTSISFANFGYGFHSYATNGDIASLNGITYDHLIAFENGGAAGIPFGHFPNLFQGGQTTVSNCSIQNCLTYQKARDGVTRIGYPWGPSSSNVTVRNNYLADGRFAIEKPINGLTMAENTIIGKLELASGVSIPPGGATVKPSATGLNYFFFPRKYDAKHHLVVYNWDKKPSVDLTLDIPQNTKYSIYSVTNLNNPWLTGVYKDTLSLPMAVRPIERPIGYSAKGPVVLSEEFGVFILETNGVYTEPTDPVTPEEPTDPEVPPTTGEPTIIEYKPVLLFLGTDGKLYYEVGGVKRLLFN